ncbi:hypothetical protein [Acetatifactor muris]|uniref:hypothetical protein n=1 Tax=Acetatifactor muris TaxID=879566 RepID=UPI0023F055B1|nr:hypothetical protein [Acetatifactor muris]
MILSLSSDVQNQAKLIRRQAKELSAIVNGSDSADGYDTNAVLIQMDTMESELAALRELINRGKEQAYLAKLEGKARPKPTAAPVKSEMTEKALTADKMEKPEKTEKPKAAEKAEKAGKAKKAEKAEKSKKAGKAEKAEKGKKAEKTGKKEKKKKKSEKKS